MGILCKAVDALLLVVFVMMSLAGPLIHAQVVLPESAFPDVLIRLKQYGADEFQYYLLVEKPHFYVALMWLDLVFLWPIALLNIYGILASKPWFNTTCLIYGASFITLLAAVLGELLESQRAPDKLLMMIYALMGAAVLALLRGLVPQSGKVASSIGKAKKRA